MWLVQPDPTLGSGIQNSRPCVVVSPPEMHDLLRTVIVAPTTTGSKPAPFRIAITHAGKKELILLDQIRAVDKLRLVTNTGALSAKTLGLLLETVQEQFAE